jgi:hypothetical protein
MVRGMAEAITAETAQYDRREWAVPVSRRNVLVTPDRVLVATDGSVRVQRIRPRAIRSPTSWRTEKTTPVGAHFREGIDKWWQGRPPEAAPPPPVSADNARVDRAIGAQVGATKIEGGARLQVDVTAPKGTKVRASGSDLFK